MRYGMCLPITGVDSDVHKTIEFALLAENAGWDAVFFEDYIVYFGDAAAPVFDPWVMLAAIAVRTVRIRFGITVTPLARRRPWKVARESVTLDHLSKGRLILGVGLGDSDDHSFANFGEETDAKRRVGMLDEALDVIAGLWSGRPFSYAGEHYRVKETTFLPRPVQEPRIPNWVGGGWPRKSTERRAARWDAACFYKVFPDGRHAMLDPTDVRDLKRSVAHFRRSDAPFDICVGGMTPADKPEEARAHVQPLAEAGATWWADFVPDDSRALRRRIEAGPPRIEFDAGKSSKSRLSSS